MTKDIKQIQEWQPIETAPTAPKDGLVDFLVYRGEASGYPDKIYIENSKDSRFYEMNGWTHWMPLPSFPMETKTTKIGG